MANEEKIEYSRKNPFPAHLKTRRVLTLAGSGKETVHYELSLAGSGLDYEVGDSMGVFCQNDPALVDEILRRLGFSGDEVVPTPAKREVGIRQALLDDCVITQPDKKFLQALVAKCQSAPLISELLTPERKAQLDEYLWGMEVIDFLSAHRSAKFTPLEFTASLRRLQPRLYSIASSLKAWPGEVHFTIASLRYHSNGRDRKGVCSCWLADVVTEQTPIPLFVHVARGFRLPEDPATPIVMVGPGTGIAPFRAYLQERKATGATGKNWLFFGEQHEMTDFHYRDEFEQYQRDGLLTHFHTAFSRDQAHKIYVQDRMMENAAGIWQWLEEGAHFFVCGNASRMAKDVDVALHKIVSQEGGRTADQAADYVEQLKKDHRYKRDVY